ncbi:MAG: hypothetical protein LBH32_15320 [Dysgonamonadaceae bacterium]|jgi:hypothetical protein|nr:hypothetical protein [Dysgonamonadaceae bacterium]
MKQIKYLLALLPLFGFFACVDDSAENPPFGEKDVPHIYVTWQTNMAYKLGQTMTFTPMVSPSDGATYRWTLNGEEISTEKDLSYPLNNFLFNAELKFEVTRNSVSNSRKASVLVTKDFVPKQNLRKLVGFLTKNGTLDDVDWQSITHLVVSSAVVKEDGTLDLAMMQTLDIPTLMAFAHHYGVYVILEVSGVINYLNSGSLYGSLTFYNPAVNNPRALTDKISQLVTDYDFDGVNIYMDECIAENYDNPAAVKEFYEMVADKIKSSKNIIDGTEYDYLMSLSVIGGWTRGALAGVVNLPQYDYVFVLAFLNENLSPVSHGSVQYAADEIRAWLTWSGLQVADPSRLILVAPAVGIRYFGVPAEFTWANLEQHIEYISYRDICGAYTDAPTKIPAVIVLKENNNDPKKEVDKIYYNGLRDMERRINEVIIPNNLGGIGLWSLESDEKNTEKSLLKKIKTILDTNE